MNCVVWGLFAAAAVVLAGWLTWKFVTPPAPPPTGVEELSAASVWPFLARPETTVVMLHAPWCSHCKAMMPAYRDAAARAPPRTVFATLEGPSAPSVVRELRVTGYPHVVKVGADGKTRAVYRGDRTAASLLAWVR